MTGDLDEAIRAQLVAALPTLFGGEEPAIDLAISSELYEVDPQSAEGFASAPRPDDRLDAFAYDPQSPPPSFALTQPPYPGPRRVRLTTDAGDRIVLREDEVVWDETDSRIFSLSPLPVRDLTEVTGVEVLYGVTAIFTTLKANQRFAVKLQSSNGDAATLDKAEALALAVLELNRQALIDDSNALYEDGDYGAAVTVKGLKLVEGRSPAPNQRHIVYHAEVELKATRALGEEEGAPIEYIRTPGRPLDPTRPIDVDIDA